MSNHLQRLPSHKISSITKLISESEKRIPTIFFSMYYILSNLDNHGNTNDSRVDVILGVCKEDFKWSIMFVNIESPYCGLDDLEDILDEVLLYNSMGDTNVEYNSNDWPKILDTYTQNVIRRTNPHTCKEVRLGNKYPSLDSAVEEVLKLCYHSMITAYKKYTELNTAKRLNHTYPIITEYGLDMMVASMEIDREGIIHNTISDNRIRLMVGSLDWVREKESETDIKKEILHPRIRTKIQKALSVWNL